MAGHPDVTAGRLLDPLSRHPHRGRSRLLHALHIGPVYPNPAGPVPVPVPWLPVGGHRGGSRWRRSGLDLWRRRAPFGVYNLTNPGFVTSRQVVDMIRKMLRPDRAFDFWQGDEEFYRVAAKTPRSNCILDVSKLLAAGVAMRPVEEALAEALRQWRPAP